MESIKEIIAKNLVELRRAKKYTQQDLARELNYSDKAISRWEHAETLPDIETLCKICDLYGVKFEYLLQKEQPKKNNPYVIKTDIVNKIIILLIALASLWLSFITAYIYNNIILGTNKWQFFIWALPLSAILCLVCNAFFFQSKLFNIIAASALCWTALLTIYIELLEHNIWMLFILGVPLQILVLLTAALKSKNEQSTPYSRG